MLFQPHVARILTANVKTLNSPAKVNGLEKFVDGATVWWKKWALALRPAYHARNLFGNMWNSYAIGGMTDASMFGQAQKILFQSLGMEMKGGVIPKASGIPRFSGSVKLGDLGSVSREDWNRAALYLDALKRTGSRQGAKKLVNDALLDYTNISPTAARWMRNKAAPFYTWYYKNSPAVVKGLFRHAYKYKHPAIIKENIE